MPHPALEENLSAESVLQAERIVAQVGPEVIMDLWEQNPDLDGVIAGRSLDAVSYTHLDVYKRQTGTCLEFTKGKDLAQIAQELAELMD